MKVVVLHNAFYVGNPKNRIDISKLKTFWSTR